MGVVAVELSSSDDVRLSLRLESFGATWSRLLGSSSVVMTCFSFIFIIYYQRGLNLSLFGPFV